MPSVNSLAILAFSEFFMWDLFDISKLLEYYIKKSYLTTRKGF